MKRPTRPARVHFLSSCHLPLFFYHLLYWMNFALIKYTKHYPREEYRRMPYFFFILPPPPPPGLSEYQFNSNTSNNFLLAHFLFAVRPCLWWLLTCTIEFAEFSTLLIYPNHHGLWLWSVKELKYAYGVP